MEDNKVLIDGQETKHPGKSKKRKKNNSDLDGSPFKESGNICTYIKYKIISLQGK